MRRVAVPLLLLALFTGPGPACGTAGWTTHPPDPYPVLVAEPMRLTFDATEGTDTDALRVVVTNVGQGEIAWTATESCPWMTLSATSGHAGDGFDVRVDTQQPPGTYDAPILVEDEYAVKSPLTITVRLRVVARPPRNVCTCDALPDPTAEVAQVSTWNELEGAVVLANANAGPRTILLEDGAYDIARPLVVTADDVTIRSVSGDRDAVALVGPGMSGSVSHVLLVAGRRFTVADLTVGRVSNHAIQIQGEQDADDALIHNVHFVDTGEQMLKVSYQAGSTIGGDRGIVECCLFEYTAGIGPQYYIGGVDCHQGADWIVRHNTFRGIRSPETALAEHAIHFWSNSSGTLVEGNVIIDCDRGIGFGLGDRGHAGGTIQNNMVHTTRDVGIGLENASGVQVLHNSVYADGYANAIEYRFAMTGATIVGNLTHGAIALRDGASGTLSDNYVMAVTDEFFVDPSSGDLHLTSAVAAVVDQVPARPDVARDYDCDVRPAGPAADIGADEWTGD